MGIALRNILVTAGMTSANAAAIDARVRDKTLVRFEEDFLGVDALANFTLNEGTDSATSAETVHSGGHAGVMRITTGDAGTGLAADGVMVVGPLQWKASIGGLTAEFRFKMSAITTCYAFLGFTDVTTLEAPIESAASADTFTSNASDAFGFMFDTRMTTDTWWLTGVKANTDGTHVSSGAVPVADEYQRLRVEADAAGDAKFYINDIYVGMVASAFTPTVALAPVIYVGKTSVAASMTADTDLIVIEAARGADGAAN